MKKFLQNTINLHRTNTRSILILIPPESVQGGIANYYQSLKGNFNYNVDFYKRGSRNWPKRRSRINEVVRIIYDIMAFTFILILRRYDIIQTNTSFTEKAIRRDRLYIKLSKLFRCKIIVFFHGWNPEYVNKIETKQFDWFRKSYLQVDAIIDLSQQNIFTLRRWGYKGPCYLSCPVIDEKWFNTYKSNIMTKEYTDDKLRILFLARLEIDKGIYETINAFSLLKKEFPNSRLIIAGDGTETENIKAYIDLMQIPDVEMLGYIVKADKAKAFLNAHLYVLPTYREGIPASIVEAMAFGLPIITTQVGGIPDIFSDTENGLFCEVKSSSSIKESIKRFIVNPEFLSRVSKVNIHYAQKQFLSNNIIKKLESIYDSIY